MKKIQQINFKRVGSASLGDPNSRGITLIALIITIIVMLILVGVTVNVALNGGLFEIAQKAARKTEQAKINEEIQAIIVEMNADILAHPENYSISNEVDPRIFFGNLVKEIEKNFKIKDESILITETIGDTTIKTIDIEVMMTKGLIYISEDKTHLKFPCSYKENTSVNIIAEFKEGTETLELVAFRLEMLNDIIEINQITEPVELTAGGNIKEIREGAPIPKGFYYVTGTKDTGVVISDSQADENNASGNNGNQFVWVPVEVNPQLKIKIDSDKDIKSVRILNTEGYDETINPNTDKFEKTINPVSNEVYETIVIYEDGTEKRKLYNFTGCYDGTNKAYNDIEILAKYSVTSIENIIDALIEEYNKNGIIVNTRTDSLKIISEENKIEDNVEEKNSVLKYGGFYIGRYELAIDNSIKKEKLPKNNISFQDAKIQTEKMYNDNNVYGVKSNLPSEAAWDSLGKWIVTSGGKSYDETYISSKNWGNFKESPTGNGTMKRSGSSEQYLVNNIYDLAGNLEEWTTAHNSAGNIVRGSNYSTMGTSVGASSFYSDNSYSGTKETIGYRPILYFYE